MEHGGDRVGKDAVGMRVQGVERFRHGGDLHLASGVHVLIEDEAHFLFLHLLNLIAAADVALDKAWARVQLERRERKLAEAEPKELLERRKERANKK